MNYTKNLKVNLTSKHSRQDIFIEVKKSSSYYVVNDRYNVLNFADDSLEKSVTLLDKQTIKFSEITPSIAFLDKMVDLENYRRVMKPYVTDDDFVDILTFGTNYNPLHYK